MVAAGANAKLDGSSLGGGRSVFLAQRLEAAAGLLDRCRGALGRGLNLESRLGLQFAYAKNLDAVAPPRDDAGLHKGLDRDRFGCTELAGVDRFLNAAQVDLVVIESRGRREAALGEAAMQRHLATLEALDAHARASRLAFAATPGLLALSRTDASADANARFRRSGIVPNFIELHCGVLTGRRRRAPDARPWRSCRDWRACRRGATCARSCSGPGP